MAIDKFIQMKKCRVELGAAVELGMHIGMSTTVQIYMPSNAGPFYLLNKKLTCNVGLIRNYPTLYDKSDKMYNKQKVLNNFPTTLFIKNWPSSKYI